MELKKRGWGVACMWYGIGNTGFPNPSGAFIEILEDATVILLTGCADIGQGSNTALAQIAAEELGVPLDNVKVISADTTVTPEAGATSASRQTYVSGNAVKNAASEAKKPLLEMASSLLGIAAEELIFKEGKVYPRSEPHRFLHLQDLIRRCRREGRMALGHGWFNPATRPLDENGQGIPYATYAFGTQYAEVEVDTQTGEVTVLKLIAAQDVGQAINRRATEGQIEGGLAMGLGYALLESLVVDRGLVKNPRYANYLVPTAADIGETKVIIVEEAEGTGPFGAKGVGEPPLIPTAPAIINAIYNAVGVRLTELPATPEKILEGLEKLGGGGQG